MGHFSFAAMLFGLLVVAAGTSITLYHQKLADHLGGGVSSYNRFRLTGVVTIVVGLIIMLNIHSWLLTTLVDLIFGGARP